MARSRAKKTLSATQQRKKEHLELCLDGEAVRGPDGTGFDRYAFRHNALPEVDIDEIDLSTTFLGKPLQAPLLISSMTGGFDLARKVNRNLADAAQRLRLAMGVGSQRVALEEQSVADSFKVRDLAPDILLLGNLGAVQLNYGYGVEHCRRAVEMIQADGLILHLNVLQEAIQPEGNRNFKGLTEKIAEVCRRLEVPVVAKEVGSGISGEVASRLERAGVRAIDVAGRGGTSWYSVEAKRAAQKGKAVDLTFADWGIPTEEALVEVRAAVPNLEVVASGGIRNGLDIAKAIALGANIAAIGQPLLAPALESAQAVIEYLSGIIAEIKVAMLCVGVANLKALTKTPLIRRTP
ncbi:MAG: type 2 isopentenyl-diphosphate Delta-isomerase [Deltaproteobacteria bacterium RIFCSPLOWO2_02_FULL_57_26]|nr:MAG: type 2 isopentenyl-diphosphate Delta-isomerase [Deltaproteobacteria bacterium RIFCSPLOWO2_02_FULL_57_26]OGQ79935.1 MAG: type 2 isopentenyl-diphosphate Delta-isomerase [Deltaproteobacteria bacterium RIFCSPLOWO2_12_FULL_57_22]